MPVTVRRVRADEWPQVRALRLDALRDPDAHLAFLETYETGAAVPDELRGVVALRGARGARPPVLVGGRSRARAHPSPGAA